MRGGSPSHAVVSLPALDLRREPSHSSELASQLLLGETVRVLGPEKSGWTRVRNDADGYTGWVRAWGLVPATAARAARWRQRARARIGVPMALIRAKPRGGAGVSPAFFGNRLIAGRASRGSVPVELPDGRRGFVPAAALAARRPPRLEERVSSLLGTPYLWGGRTPAGYDCSAFVQQVLLEQGLELPRDAREQCRVSRKLPPAERLRPGDLAFFRRPGEPASHVGLALGDGYFAHCRGRVTVSSVDPENALCDKDLLPQFMGWHRPSASDRPVS